MNSSPITQQQNNDNKTETETNQSCTQQLRTKTNTNKSDEYKMKTNVNKKHNDELHICGVTPKISSVMERRKKYLGFVESKSCIALDLSITLILWVL